MTARVLFTAAPRGPGVVPWRRPARRGRSRRVPHRLPVRVHPRRGPARPRASVSPMERRDETTASPDERLLARLRDDRSAAFAELVHAHGPTLLTLARRFLANEEDARDAVQEAFVSAYRAIDDFAGEARLSTWLHRITVNACLMKRRARRRRPELRLDELLPRFLEDGHHVDPPAPWDERGDVAAMREETRRLVRDAIDRLPDGYRSVLLLRDIEGLGAAETGRVLELTPNAVTVRLHRARQALRALLDRHFRREDVV